MSELPEGVTVKREEHQTVYYRGKRLLCGAFETILPVGWASYRRGVDLYIGESRIEAEAACIKATWGEA